jgi:hypothetical protein
MKRLICWLFGHKPLLLSIKFSESPLISSRPNDLITVVADKGTFCINVCSRCMLVYASKKDTK